MPQDNSQVSAVNTQEKSEYNIYCISQEYLELFLLETLSAKQQARMELILEISSRDEQLLNLIEEVETECSDQLGLLDKTHREFYENQKAVFKEYRDTSFFNKDEATLVPNSSNRESAIETFCRVNVKDYTLLLKECTTTSNV